MSFKFTQAYNFWSGWKWKSAIETEYKGKNNNFSYNFSLQKKKFYAAPAWLKFVSQYNEVYNVGFSEKLQGKKKVDTSYKGHLSTQENHKFFVEHKFSKDLGT
jgi:hypothetical protein